MQRVLVVEDDGATREALAALIERHGFCVVTAAGVDSALRILASTGTDVVVSDVMIPGDGRYLLEYIRREFPDLPVILVTAAENPPRGSFACFEKPVEPAELIRALRCAVAPGSV